MNNNKVLIITKHKKEQAIAPSFVNNGYSLEVANIDTDVLGTFSGEIERTLSPKDAAKEKIKLGIAKFPDFKFYLASEGSFFSHPQSPFITVDEEYLVLYDKGNDFFREVRVVSYETQSIERAIDLNNYKEVLNDCDFPNHGIILKGDNNQIIKDIKSDSELLEYLKTKTNWVISNDLRAMNNPKRMKVIGEAAGKLMNEFKIICPKCQSNLNKIEKTVYGLECKLCHTPSKYAKGTERNCYNCKNSWFVKNELDSLDPKFCDFCNP